ncbi:MAG TPA: PHP domain-containing protein [Candidatus Angelobacter sp.]
MIDLHTHTTCSDGTSTPEALVQEACSAGLRALAITDHDTFAGFDAALPLARQHGLELICGLELSTHLESGQNGRKATVHLLGYFLNHPPPPDFREWLTTISSTRRQRNLQLMAHLRKRGIALAWEDLPLPPHALGRAHFARVLVAKGHVPDQHTAFALHLSDEALAGIHRKLPALTEGIERITRAGGLTSLAHPVRLPCRELPAQHSLIGEIAGSGLHAIEAYHCDHNSQDTDRLLQLAGDLDLLVTGGSDYHGANKPGVLLGKGRGDLAVAYAVLERMKHHACISNPPLR